MKEENQVLWSMYQEHCVQGRHHETQRSTVTSILLSISAAILALVSLDKEITRADIPMGLLLIVIGLFGALFCAKHYERFRIHMKRARNYRDALDANISEIDIKKLKKIADETHASADILSTLPLNKLWVFLNVLIAVIGVFVALVGSR